MTAGRPFKDHFSSRSGNYARYRPSYPETLFRFIAEQSNGQELAWDCATGSGQSARCLTAHFKHVIATDASDAQIAAAIGAPGITYRVAAAEDSGLDGQSVDALTVAQALHWFDLPRFFVEAERVIKPGGLLVTWCYGLCQVCDEVDAKVNRLYADIVDAFWPAERRYVESGYADISYPAPLIAVPDFEMRVSWSAADFLGYLRTWSACKRYERHHGHDAVALIDNDLHDSWGSALRDVVWPLTVRACRLPH